VTIRAVSGLADVTTVRLDRPFPNVIHDVQTATPLFLGRDAEPTSVG
jgi:hypothetical protein